MKMVSFSLLSECSQQSVYNFELDLLAVDRISVPWLSPRSGEGSVELEARSGAAERC